MIEQAPVIEQATVYESTADRLDKSAAVACRVIRAGRIPLEYLHWLASPSDHPLPPPVAEQTLQFAAQQSLDRLLQPMLRDASKAEISDARDAAKWLASISHFVAAKHYAHGRIFSLRTIAMSLLPLYRALATGKLGEGLQQTRRRLAETLVLLGLCDEFYESPNDDLAMLLDEHLQKKRTPQQVLLETLGLDLIRIAGHTRNLVAAFEPEQRRFDTQAIQHGLADPMDQDIDILPWSAPDLLWDLAGELLSNKTEMVLPREWVETPVPWSSIGEHWSQFARIFIGLSAESTAENASPCLHATTGSETHSRNAAHLDLQAEADLKNLNTAPAPSAESAARTALTPCAASTGIVATTNFEALTQFKVQADQSVSTNIQHATVPSGKVDAPPETTSAQTTAHNLPKVLIVEIRSHNDPVFTNVLKRQIANCRVDSRTVSIANIIVEPEDETNRQDVCGVRDSGMTLWQQKLVNLLAEQPNVVDPIAFLTSDGELILCALDIERNELTLVLRQGLAEVLTGQSVEGSNGQQLSKVHVPAKYHIGIAATSAPGANFAPEQLVVPALRCLAAAKCQGKSSIKSIEVY